MKRSLYSRPEQFSLSPLLALVPELGGRGKLESLVSSLFARYEKVIQLKHEMEAGSELSSQEREALKKFSAEAEMLKQVLDWLAVKPESY